MNLTPFCKHANHTQGVGDAGRVWGMGKDGLKCDQPLAPAKRTLSLAGSELTV